MSLDDAQHFLFLLIQGYAVHSLRDQRDEKVTRYNKVKKKVKILKLQLLSIALSNDNMLLHQDYCPDLETKMKNADFFFIISSPLVHTAKSHKEQGNYDTCVC